MNEFKEITKEQFKKIYFDHPDLAMNAQAYQNYWDKFYEHEEGATYQYKEPATSKESRLMIVRDSSVKGKHTYRIFFLSIDAEESFFDMAGAKER